MRGNIYNKIIYSILGLKILSSLVFCFTYFRGPHIVRQIDTLAVSMRYYFDLFLSDKLTFNSFLPKVLSAGDKVGISPMEFPILNLAISPAFAFGPEYGKAFARLFLVILVLILTYIHYRLWKGFSFKGISFEKASLLIPIFGLSQIYFEKFMPDFLAFILVSLSVGMSRRFEGKYLFKFLLATLGLLVKPPSVLAFGPLLLIKPPKKVLKDIGIWIFPAFLITVIYYTLGIKFLKSMMDMEPYFLVHFRSPIQSLIDFFGNPKGVFDLLNKGIFPPYIFLVFLFWDIVNRVKNKTHKFPLQLWGLFLLQILGVVFLDGGHVFVHSYYALSVSFVGCMFLSYFIDYAQKHLVTIVVIALVIFNVESIVHRAKPLWRSHLFTQCSSIRNNIDIHFGSKIRTNFTNWPTLGLCLGVIQNSNVAKYGVYQKTIDAIPAEGEQVFETADLVVKKFY